jgi:hypothetical protein
VCKETLNESTRVLVAVGAAVAGGIAIAALGIAPLIRAADFIAPVGLAVRSILVRW